MKIRNVKFLKKAGIDIIPYLTPAEPIAKLLTISKNDIILK